MDKPQTFLRIPGCRPDCLIPGFLESKPCFQNQNFGCRLIWGEASFTIQEIYSIEGKKQDCNQLCNCIRECDVGLVH